MASIAGFGNGVALAGDVVVKPVYGLQSLSDPATLFMGLAKRGSRHTLATGYYGL